MDHVLCEHIQVFIEIKTTTGLIPDASSSHKISTYQINGIGFPPMSPE